MLAKLFSFRGRLTRLEFLGWTIASIAVVAALSMVLTAVAMLGANVLLVTVAPGTIGLAVGALLVVVAVWSNLAICAKRVRDVGLSPILVIGGMIVLTMVDLVVLTQYTPTRFYRPLADHTMVGGIVLVGFVAMLLFWHSQGRDAKPSTYEAAARPVRAPRPEVRNTPPRGEFGLRTR